MKITHAYEDISRWFFESLEALITEKELITVGLAWGSSFDGWYRELLSPEWAAAWEAIDTERIRWWLTDERIRCDTQDRNDDHIWGVFLEPLCRMWWSKEAYFKRPDRESDGREYTQRVGEIDIAFFGLGPDGHTASLFPRHPALESSETGFIVIENAPKPPPWRISLSPKSIQNLHHVCLFAVGTSKKQALADFLDPSASLDDCPAKLLKPEILFDWTHL